MLYTQTVKDTTLELLKSLMKDDNIDNGIRLASLEDICAMKLNAIAGNGTRIMEKNTDKVFEAYPY